MQQRAPGGELASLGYVRRQASEGSRGRAAPASSGSGPRQAGGGDHRHDRPDPAARGNNYAPPMPRGGAQGKGGGGAGAPSVATAEAPSLAPGAMEAVAEALAELKEAQKASEDTQSLRARVDQISVRLSTLDNAVKSQEKGVASLRCDLSSVAKSQGGQQAERAEALARQVHTLEDSFCEFSSRLDRELQELAAGVQAGAGSSAAPAPAEEEAEGTLEQRVDQLDEAVSAMAAKIRACEDAIMTLKPSDTQQSAEKSAQELRADVCAWTSAWIKAEIVPELKRSLAAADHADIFQAAGMSAYEKVSSRLDNEIAARMAASQQTWHRWSFDMEAVLLRDTNGLCAGQRVLLRHPIQQIADVTYMHRLRRGADAEVVAELFAVEDTRGPIVAFTDGNACAPAEVAASAEVGAVGNTC